MMCAAPQPGIAPQPICVGCTTTGLGVVLPCCCLLGMHAPRPTLHCLFPQAATAEPQPPKDQCRLCPPPRTHHSVHLQRLAGQLLLLELHKRKAAARVHVDVGHRRVVHGVGHRVRKYLRGAGRQPGLGGCRQQPGGRGAATSGLAESGTGQGSTAGTQVSTLHSLQQPAAAGRHRSTAPAVPRLPPSGQVRLPAQPPAAASPGPKTPAAGPW